MTLQVQIWSFSPLAEKTYTLRPTLTFWPIQTPGCNKSQLTLKVVGMGSKGFIEVGLSFCMCYFMCVCIRNVCQFERKVKCCTSILELELPNQAVCVCLLPLQAEKALLDVGEILVGSYQSIEVPLVNKSPCSVSFCLSVQQRLLDKDPIYDPETVPSGTLFCDILSGHFTYDVEYLILAFAFVSRVNGEYLM